MARPPAFTQLAGIITTEPIPVWTAQLEEVVADMVQMAMERGYTVQVILTCAPGKAIPSPKVSFYTRGVDKGGG